MKADRISDGLLGVNPIGCCSTHYDSITTLCVLSCPLIDHWLLSSLSSGHGAFIKTSISFCYWTIVFTLNFAGLILRWNITRSRNVLSGFKSAMNNNPTNARGWVTHLWVWSLKSAKLFDTIIHSWISSASSQWSWGEHWKLITLWNVHPHVIGWLTPWVWAGFNFFARELKVLLP